jgi:hypothetical protein
LALEGLLAESSEAKKRIGLAMFSGEKNPSE